MKGEKGEIPTPNAQKCDSCANIDQKVKQSWQNIQAFTVQMKLILWCPKCKRAFYPTLFNPNTKIEEPLVKKATTLPPNRMRGH